MKLVSVTLLVSHALMSSLKVVLPKKRLAMLEMRLVFHVDMCPYLAVAALGSATHSPTAV
eukprot:scaffold5785_cov344-Pinguiococcus_pyrenoidosus.AAC.1